MTFNQVQPGTTRHDQAQPGTTTVHIHLTTYVSMKCQTSNVDVKFRTLFRNQKSNRQGYKLYIDA